MTRQGPLPAPLGTAPRVTDWIRFEPDGRILVLSGRVELGQGNLTAILQMAADELDVAPERVSITGADTTRTPDEGFTSGSMSIMLGGQSVRFAASAARHLVLAEAARLLQTTPDRLSIEDGQVLSGGVETDLDLWKLAAQVDLAVEVSAFAAPKAPSERRVVGRSLPRIDLRERVTGSPFVHDIVMEGMLHGRPVHPPHIGARLASLDIEALRGREGVNAVFRDGQFVGIVADTEPQAIAAARRAASEARYESDVAAPDDAVEAIGGATGEVEVVAATGDPAAIRGREFRTRVTRPYLSHGSIGPSAAVALWSGDRLQVWTHSQGVYPLRQALSDVVGLPLDRIDVIHRPGAGCYGHNGADDVALDAVLMARAVPGRPVKVVWSRADEFRCAPLAPAMSTRARLVLDDHDTIAAMEVEANSAPHGNRPGRNGAPNLRAAAYLEKPFPVPRSADIPPAKGGGADRNAVPLYRVPNLRAAKRLVHELPYRTSSMRALGGHLNVYAIETLMDAVAAEIGEDPVAFRLRHLDDPRARAVIEGVMADAGDIVARGHDDSSGWGLGFARYKNTAAYCAIVARVELDETIRVTDVRACVDTGEVITPDGAINQTQGGILQAISWTLKEAVTFDGPSVATESWLDYPILRFSEVPAMRVSLIDRPEEPPLGVAEAAAGPTAAALGNALHKIIGRHVTDLPLTRDAVMTAMMES